LETIFNVRLQLRLVSYGCLQGVYIWVAVERLLKRQNKPKALSDGYFHETINFDFD